MGVVGLPSRVTGLRAISISDDITFMPACQASSNSSQWDLALGLSWRLIFKMTVLLAIRYLSRFLTAKSQKIHFAASYFLARGGISETSTGSNSNFGSSASGAKYAFVVFIQFLSSRSGKSGL